MKGVFNTLGELGGTFFGGTLGERECVPPCSPGKKHAWQGGGRVNLGSQIPKNAVFNFF